MKTEYKLGWYRKPFEHHGHPVFVKSVLVHIPKGYKDGKRIDAHNVRNIIGHTYILRSTWRRFLVMTRKKAARQKNIRRQQLFK